MQVLEILMIFFLSGYMDDGTEDPASTLQWMLPFRAKAGQKEGMVHSYAHTIPWVCCKT